MVDENAALAGIFTERDSLPALSEGMLARIVSIGDRVRARLREAEGLQRFVFGGYPG